MKPKYVLLILLTFLISISAQAQFKDYTIKGGIQYQQLLPFSEYATSMSFIGRGFLNFEITKGVSIDIGGGYGQYKTDDDFNEHTHTDNNEGDKHYVKTDLIPIEARLRLSPWANNKKSWNPYFYLGAGLMNYSVKEIPDNPLVGDYSEKRKGWTVSLPLGVGTEAKLSDNVLLDISAGVSYPFTDELNNFVLGPYEDASANLALGLSFTGSDMCETDLDKDGLTYCREEQIGTDPNNPDTDGDGCKDGEEVNTYMTNPLNKDTDGDTLGDCDEIRKYMTNPLSKDTDNDKLMDNEEINIYGTLPTDSDTDNDNLIDGDEVLIHKTDPKNPDTDGGSVPDGVEVARGSDPLNPDDDLPKKEEEPIKVGEVITLEGINFATNSWEITSIAEDQLEKALNAMKNYPELEVEISGHTDSRGGREWNMELSQKRADSVKDWFVSKGISGSRITTVGYGPDQPVAPNDTEDGRFKNRRIDFKRLK